jgi:Tfp pilus assembly protein PilF
MVFLAWGLVYFGSRSYLSDYYVVAATRGEKSAGEFEEFLRKALSLNSDSAPANSEFSKMLVKKKDFAEALRYHQTAMEAFRPLAFYEQRGYIYELLSNEAKEPAEKRRYTDLSATDFEFVVGVNPVDLSSWENLMLKAYRENDDKRLDELARQVMTLDRDNQNAIYLRALAAERAGNFRAAYNLLQTLATSRENGRRLFFKPEDVRNRALALSRTIPHNP